MVTRYDTLLERAQCFDYTSDIDIAETLLAIAQINALNSTDLIAK